MKYFLTGFLLLVALYVSAQISPCDSIIWSSARKLTWEDYRGQPVASQRAAATTNYNFLHRWHIERSVLTGKVICIFSPCRSWSKNKNSADLLMHEQGHFDIAEYFRRVYNKRILEEKYTPATLRLVTLKTYVDIQLECARLQDEYDAETNHSLIKSKQAQWLAKISNLLNSMKRYDQEEVTVNLP